MHTHPPTLEIVPLTNVPNCTVSVPGSKSITNRALVLAALCSRGGPCRLSNALRSEDTEVMVDGLRRLGYQIEVDWPTVVVSNDGTDLVPNSEAELSVANSGTTMRFLTALCAVGCGRYRLDGVARMRERPIGDLLDALRQCGVKAESEQANDCPPVIIETSGFTSEGAIVQGQISSQFVSALLMVAPMNVSETMIFGIRLEGTLVSEPYVKMTESMMLQWGSTWRYDAPSRTYLFDLDSLAHYFSPDEYAIEPDASAASYFFAAAAITGGRILVRGMKREMLQGDVLFVDALARMGCLVTETDEGIAVEGRPLRGIDIDMNAISDTMMSLAAVACFAEGTTTIRNVAHVRHKETDRIAAMAAELRKLGASVDEFDDGLTITPGALHGATVETYRDHRMAMSLALIGLKVPGVVIDDPGCVAKTYPGFWQDLDALRA